jgi:integrase/recombinase XerD
MNFFSVLSPDKRRVLHSQIGGPALSLDEGLDEFVNVGMPYLKLSEGTRLAYQRDLTDLVKFLKKQQQVKTWSEVGLSDLQRYLADTDRRKLSASTRNRRTWAIKKLFRFLFTSQYLKENPAEKLVPVAVVRRDPSFLTEQEYTRFLEVVHEPRDRAIIMLYLQVGMTCSEVAGLCVVDVSLPSQITAQSDDVGFVQVKRRRGTQHLPLNWKVSDTLSTWLDERAAIDTTEVLITEALFISGHYKTMTKSAIQKMIKRYEKKAGLRGVNSRKLRHTMATHYLAKGGDIQATQELLGLHTLKQMGVYVKAANKVQRKMVQELAL